MQFKDPQNKELYAIIEIIKSPKMSRKRKFKNKNIFSLQKKVRQA
jgi:hypothetical protein